jgi:hypothetical protein
LQPQCPVGREGQRVAREIAGLGLARGVGLDETFMAEKRADARHRFGLD